MSRKAVAITMLVLALAIIGWDIYLFLDKYPHNTISALTNEWAYITSLLPFACGALLGHFFFNYSKKERISYFFMVPFIIPILITDLALQGTPKAVMIAIMPGIGYAFGRLFFSKRRPSAE